jgi:hypothetical protein
MTNINGQLPSVQENTAQILNDIQSLQAIEQELFSSLEENTGLTTKQQQEVIEKINNISKMRINLYKTLDSINNFYKKSFTNSKGTLIEQTAAIDIVEKELNTSKKRLQTLEEEKNNKIRLVEINEYYGRKYSEHSDLMKIIIIMLIPIVILIVLFNKGIIPASLHYVLVVVIIVIGSYYISKTIFSIILRDRMNYQQYDWYFDLNKAPKSNPKTASKLDPWASKSLSLSTDFITCIGNECCSDGLVYDSDLNKCINSNDKISTASKATILTTATEIEPKKEKAITTETFVNNIFTKFSNIYKKPDVILDSNNIKSNNSESFINYSKF